MKINRKNHWLYFLAGVIVGIFFVYPWLSRGEGNLVERLSGMVLLRVEDKGQAWYVYPQDGRRYYLGRPEDAWRIMTGLGLGIKDDDLAKIPLAKDQFDSPPLGKNHLPWLFMKLVPLDISDNDLAYLQRLGIKVVGGSHGIEQGAQATLAWLDRLQQYGLKAVINLANEASWIGDDPTYPQWQKEKVRLFIEAVSAHPAVWGYDISNEAGENLISGYKYGHRISLSQLKEAAQTVRSADQSRPLLLRMHYWDEEDGDFGWDNPFTAGLVDVIMLNLYSNYSLNGRDPSLPNMVSDRGEILINKIKAVDGQVKIWLSLASFAEPPKFLLPSSVDLKRDISSALSLDIEALGFYGWGSSDFKWYLPRDGQGLLQVIEEYSS